jgi:ABC-type lipoprotein export system ATPase subunit
MHWAGGSIGLKKDIINRSEISFTAAASFEAYEKGRAALTSAQVRDRLLDCSDAHHFSDADEKDRIGNCFTWVNSDPTFAGLLHAIEEFDERVYVGDEPARVRAVRTNPSSVIDAVTIRPRSEDVAEVFFDDVAVEMNNGFVAIIGNKGQGKSALVDIIGLLGNSRNEESFSFLSRARFRNPKKNSARTHSARLRWLDSHDVERTLDDRTDDEQTESVTYLPQSLIDEICSDEPGVAADRFRAELEVVVFSHISSADRLGASSLAQLLAQKTESLEERLRLRRAEMGKLNRDIAQVRRLAAKARVESLRDELKQLQDREAQWLTQEPAIVPLPEDSDSDLLHLQAQLGGAEAERARISAEIDRVRATDAEVASKHEAGRQLETAIETLESQVERFRLDHQATLERLGVSPSEILTFVVTRQPLMEALTDLTEQRELIRAQLDPEVEGSLGHQFTDASEKVDSFEATLGAPARAHAESVKDHRDWASVLDGIRGLTEEERGIEDVKKDLEEIDRAEENLTALIARRMDLVRTIHSVLMDVVSVYQAAYRPAVDFIESHRVAASAGLEFAANLRVIALRERLWEMVARNASGAFLGREEADEKVGGWIDETVFADVDSLISFLHSMDEAINDGAALGSDPDRIIKKGRSIEELYDFLFGLSYLEPHFLLLYRSVSIDELSPGEKGTLLLVFYLLVDRSNKPLMLDQPDENLDNQTVHNVLVPALKEAKKRRQIIVVTHSPNVAVVADADQVIVGVRDERRFTYVSGAIEDPVINSHVVNVLEGTWPAFRNRHSKYQKLVGSPSAGG